MSLELKAPSRLKPLGEHATSSCDQKVHAWLEFCEQEGWVRSVSTKQKCKRNQGEKKDKQMPVEELVGRGSGKRLTHFGEVFVVWGIWRVFFPSIGKLLECQTQAVSLQNGQVILEGQGSENELCFQVSRDWTGPQCASVNKRADTGRAPASCRSHLSSAGCMF